MADTRHVAVGVETTWGTAVAPTRFIEALNEQLQLEAEFDRAEAIRNPIYSNIEQVSTIVRGGFTSKGNYQDHDTLLYLLIGSVSSTTAGAPYTHTYTLDNDSSRTDISGTFEVARGNATKGWRYAGCKVTGWTLSGSGAGVLESAWTVVGKDEATGTIDTTPTFPDSDLINSKNVSVSFDNGSTTLCPVAMNLNFNWPVDEVICWGASALSRQPQDAGIFTITGSVDVVFEDGEMTEYGYYTADSATDIQIIGDDGTHSITIDLNTCKVTQGTPHLDGRNRLLGTFTFEAYGGATIALVNDQADPAA